MIHFFLVSSFSSMGSVREIVRMHGKFLVRLHAVQGANTRAIRRSRSGPNQHAVHSLQTKSISSQRHPLGIGAAVSSYERRRTRATIKHQCPLVQWVVWHCCRRNTFPPMPTAIFLSTRTICGSMRIMYSMRSTSHGARNNFICPRKRGPKFTYAQGGADQNSFEIQSADQNSFENLNTIVVYVLNYISP